MTAKATIAASIVPFIFFLSFIKSPSFALPFRRFKPENFFALLRDRKTSTFASPKSPLAHPVQPGFTLSEVSEPLSFVVGRVVRTHLYSKQYLIRPLFAPDPHCPRYSKEAENCNPGRNWRPAPGPLSPSPGDPSKDTLPSLPILLSKAAPVKDFRAEQDFSG